MEPSNIVLTISRRAYMARMTSCWPRWTAIPEGVREAIWQDFLVCVVYQLLHYVVMYIMSIHVCTICSNCITHIFSNVQGEVDLADADVSVVRRHWSSKIAKNYRETINSIKTSGKRPHWMSEAVFDEFATWWSNEDFVVNLSYI